MARRRTHDDMPDETGFDRFNPKPDKQLGEPPMPPTDFSQQPTPDDVKIPGIGGGIEPPQGPINLPPSGGGAGNSERPRDVFPDNEPRQPFVPEPPPQVFAPEPVPVYAPPPEPAPAPEPPPLFTPPSAPSVAPPAATEPGGIDLSLLPASVEAPAPAPSQTAEAAPQSTAMAPIMPTPVSTQGQPPASPSTVAPSTPARQPFASPSAIFSTRGPRSIGGRGTGLTGGGLSMPGGPSGAPKPTEEMLQLLRSLGIGNG